MTSINKIFDMFRNLKSDAVPRPPRPNKEKPTNTEPDDENNENIDSSNEPEEILVESDDEVKSDEKTKSKSFFKPNKKDWKSNKDWKQKKDKHSSNAVNTQATGNVINVVGSHNIRWGNDYYMGPMHHHPFPKNFHFEEEEQDESVKKTAEIQLLLEAKIKPEHEYIDHISKNLGKDWQKFFIKLGYKKNRIETFEIDTEKYGVSEARYKLLLDWIENEEDPALGRLAAALWKTGERQLVKELAIMYSVCFGKNRK